MPGDITRRTWEPTQQYRRPLYQQGRTLFDTDGNEGLLLLGEEQRMEALDFVGPLGSPDDGFLISLPITLPPPAGGWNAQDFQINAGSLYVGGMRMELLDTVTYLTQPDALGLAAPPAVAREFVYGEFTEHEHSATEIDALKEVSLGGPDTTGRVRIARRVRRRATSAVDCTAAWAEQVALWLAEGLVFDPHTMRLLPQARLQVTFPASAIVVDPCDPPGAAGFLGAFNQTIRVQLTSTNRFVWGYDNASFEYRVEPGSVVTGATTTRLRLETPPPDDFHQPRTGQVVGVMRAEMRLPEGEYTALHQDLNTTIAAPYNPDTREIVLNGVLTAPYVDAANSATIPTRLFIQVWEEEVTFAPNVPANLTGTGMAVTLQGTAFTPGSYWEIAVRPSTPQEVYPARLKTFQPPDGPRRWASPLAVIDWTPTLTVTDCRPKFENLVELTRRRCCTRVVFPGESIQAAINSLPPEGGCVCLKPGIHRIRTPILIQHPNITLHGETIGAIVLNEFAAFLLHIDSGADRIAVHDIEWRTSVPLQLAAIRGMITIEGVREVSITDCVFRFTGTLSATPTNALGLMMIESEQIRIERCEFLDLTYGIYGGLLGETMIRDNRFLGPVVPTPGAGGSASAGYFAIDIIGGRNRPVFIVNNEIENYFNGVVIEDDYPESLIEKNRITGPRLG